MYGPGAERLQCRTGFGTKRKGYNVDKLNTCIKRLMSAGFSFDEARGLALAATYLSETGQLAMGSMAVQALKELLID